MDVVATVSLDAVAVVLAVPAPTSTATTTVAPAAKFAIFLKPIGTPLTVHSFTPHATIATSIPVDVGIT